MRHDQTVFPDVDVVGDVTQRIELGAATNPRFRLRNTKERLYRGQCKNNDLLPDTFRQFSEKRDRVFELINGLDMLSNRNKREVSRFLGYFYNDINDRRKIAMRFIDKCNDPV